MQLNIFCGIKVIMTSIHKSLFHTSRLIVDNIAQRADYTEISKVFHISLLYFNVGNGAIHHGKTVIQDIETKEKLQLHFTNQKTGEIFDATDIIPKYFFISVPLFNDRLEKDIDDWLYVMKHEQVPAHNHSPKLSALKMTPAERVSYISYQKQLYSDRDELIAAEQRGIEKGMQKAIEKGREEEKISIAKAMLDQNIDIQMSANITGIDIDIIRKL
jgi:predicted transposase/invertase (TIGR01784 family)